ncbi:hypothetical protein MBLNU459_g0522t2 [Dothideomycetes sp. NU459]
MWVGLFALLGLSLIMAIASFGAGSLPLSISLSPRQLRLITAVGTGVLVGTSLIVIIPEGIETLYSARGLDHAHSSSSRSLSSRHIHHAIPLDSQGDAPRAVEDRRTNPVLVSLYVSSTGHAERLHDYRRSEETAPPQPAAGVPGSKEPLEEHSEWEPHAWVGISLISGFILMYLVDRLPRHASASSQPQPSYISLNRFTLRRSGTQDDEQIDHDSIPSDDAHQSRPSSTTVGLVIHAAADGIALGASSTGSSRRLGLIVFLALMIHKAPAAFGLTSVLLKQGLSKRRARSHLVVFSLAAPVGALVTWATANTLGKGNFGGEEGTQFFTGVLLLFSGGTFL